AESNGRPACWRRYRVFSNLSLRDKMKKEMIAKKVGRNEDAASPSRTGTITRDACATWNKLLFVGWLVVPLNVGLMLSANAAESSLKFAGIPFSPGSTVRANVPLNPQEKPYAGQGGNPVPQSAVAVLATPANFDPRKSWPVLIAFSTNDFKRQNRDDLVEFYRRVGLGEGWVLLAGDGPQPARNDTVGWRAAMTMAAINALHRSFAGSEKWPIVCAGFSGGAKSASFVAPLLTKSGCRIIGI